MANATAITINNTVANGFLTDPTPDTLDTGTAPVTLPVDLQGKTDRVLFRIKNLAAEPLQVTFKAGDYPPAFRSQLGDYAPATLVQNAVGWYGPFESARFVQKDTGLLDRMDVMFTPGATINAQVTCFRLPKV